MFDKIRLTFLLIVFLCGVNIAAFADIIHLTSGQTIEGRIVERTNDEIKVDTGIGVLVTYYLDEIENISSSSSDSSDIPETDQGNFEDTPRTIRESGRVPTEQVRPSGTAPKPAAGVEPPPSEVKTGSREELFLLQQYKKTAQEMEQAKDPSMPPPPPMDKEQYLQKQLTEKQALLKEEISRNIHLADQKITQGVKAFLNGNPQIKQTLSAKSLPPHFPAAVAAIFIGFYAFVCCPWMIIARKLGLAGWLAWIPIIQIFLLFRMANRPLWWIFFLLIPIINILIAIMLWMDIAKRFNKSVLLGILMIVPILNLLIPWYLAFSPAAEQ